MPGLALPASTTSVIRYGCGVGPAWLCPRFSSYYCFFFFLFFLLFPPSSSSTLFWYSILPLIFVFFFSFFFFLLPFFSALPSPLPFPALPYYYFCFFSPSFLCWREMRNEEGSQYACACMCPHVCVCVCMLVGASLTGKVAALTSFPEACIKHLMALWTAAVHFYFSLFLPCRSEYPDQPRVISNRF